MRTTAVGWDFHAEWRKVTQRAERPLTVNERGWLAEPWTQTLPLHAVRLEQRA